jgi:hypothetical protein
MKKKARILKRIRQRIEYENDIARKAERALTGVPLKTSMTVKEMLMSYGMTDAIATSYMSERATSRLTYYVHDEIIMFDTETAPLRPSVSLRTSAVSTFLDDGVISHGWYKTNVRESAEKAICVQVQEPPLVPVVRVRSGRYGAAGLLAPSIREAVASGVTEPEKSHSRLVLRTSHRGP